MFTNKNVVKLEIESMKKHANIHIALILVNSQCNLKSVDHFALFFLKVCFCFVLMYKVFKERS